MRLNSFNLITTLALMSIAGCASAWAQGTIRGTVRDDNGRALPFARIKLARLNPDHLIPRYDRADENGEFVIGPLSWGSYMLCAGKEEDGYADTLADMHATAPRPTTTLSPETPTQIVNIRLGPRAGILKIVSLTDALTGEKVKAASVKIWRADNNAFVDTSAKLELFMPALTKVFVKVTAPGYADWFYPGHADQSRAIPIVVRSQETLPIVVSLQPASR